MHIFPLIYMKHTKLQQENNGLNEEKRLIIFSLAAARIPSLKYISFWGTNITQEGGVGQKYAFQI